MRGYTMGDHATHRGHAHAHGPACGHAGIAHDDHTDYLHEGHLHHVHVRHVDEHALPVDGPHAPACTPEHACEEHTGEHVHGPACGHPRVPHGDHVDYLVGDHLHHSHGLHCDAHGPVQVR